MLIYSHVDWSKIEFSRICNISLAEIACPRICAMNGGGEGLRARIYRHKWSVVLASRGALREIWSSRYRAETRDDNGAKDHERVPRPRGRFPHTISRAVNQSKQRMRPRR